MIVLVVSGTCWLCDAELSPDLPGALLRRDDGSMAALPLCKRCVYQAEELDWARAPQAGEEPHPP